MLKRRPPGPAAAAAPVSARSVSHCFKMAAASRVSRLGAVRRIAYRGGRGGWVRVRASAVSRRGAQHACLSASAVSDQRRPAAQGCVLWAKGSHTLGSPG